MKMRVAAGSMLGCLVAGCASAPALEPGPWVQPDALRSCLALKIPPELMRQGGSERVTIAIELTVLPSGRIESATVVSDPDEAALDTFLAEALVALPCAPFAPVEALHAYPVRLQLQVDVKR